MQCFRAEFTRTQVVEAYPRRRRRHARVAPHHRRRTKPTFRTRPTAAHAVVPCRPHGQGRAAKTGAAAPAFTRSSRANTSRQLAARRGTPDSAPTTRRAAPPRRIHAPWHTSTMGCSLVGASDGSLPHTVAHHSRRVADDTGGGHHTTTVPRHPRDPSTSMQPMHRGTTRPPTIQTPLRPRDRRPGLPSAALQSIAHHGASYRRVQRPIHHPGATAPASSNAPAASCRAAQAAAMEEKARAASPAAPSHEPRPSRRHQETARQTPRTAAAGDREDLRRTYLGRPRSWSRKPPRAQPAAAADAAATHQPPQPPGAAAPAS